MDYEFETPKSETIASEWHDVGPYFPEIVNVVNAVESILPPDVAKKVDNIKNQALALITALRENETLNQTKVGFAENHLRHFLHWVCKVHDGKP